MTYSLMRCSKYLNCSRLSDTSDWWLGKSHLWYYHTWRRLSKHTGPSPSPAPGRHHKWGAHQVGRLKGYLCSSDWCKVVGRSQASLISLRRLQLKSPEVGWRSCTSRYPGSPRRRPAEASHHSGSKLSAIAARWGRAQQGQLKPQWKWSSFGLSWSFLHLYE